MNPVVAAATAVVALCAVCAAVAVPVKRRDSPEEDQQQHHHHHHHKGGNTNHNNITVDLEVALVQFLDAYYDKYVKPPPPPPPSIPDNIYDQMQSDQPVTHNPDYLVGNNGTDYASMKRV